VHQTRSRELNSRLRVCI